MSSGLMISIQELIEGTGITNPPDYFIYESHDNIVTFMDEETGELLYINTLH